MSSSISLAGEDELKALREVQASVEGERDSNGEVTHGAPMKTS